MDAPRPAPLDKGRETVLAPDLPGCVMAFSDDLFFAPAGRLVALLKARKVSAAEMTRQFFQRIDALNPGLNAVVTLVKERATREAAESDQRLARDGQPRPLEGLPVTIKDSIITEGVRSTWGMKIFEDYVSDTDAPVVARLRAAGAIVIGKTNTPEMTFDYDCDNPLFGPTKNPWNRERTGRVQRGRSRCIGGRHVAAGPGLRRRRFDSGTGTLLRHRWTQAKLGNDSAGRTHVTGARRTTGLPHGDAGPDGAIRR